MITAVGERFEAGFMVTFARVPRSVGAAIALSLVMCLGVWTPAKAVPLPGTVFTEAGSVGSGVATSIGQLPYSLATDGNGSHVYVGDFLNPVVRSVDLSSGQESAFAGNDGYGFSGDGGQATLAMIQGAGAISHCGTDTYIADTFNYVIRKIDANGVLTTVAGTGKPGYSG